MTTDTCRVLRTATLRTLLTLGAMIAYLLLLGVLTRPAHAQQRPTAVFNATCSGLTCQFSGQGSGWPNGVTTSDARVWDFGDGASRGGPPYATIVTHTYARADSFRVRYTITDRLGLTDDTARMIYVGITPPPPVPSPAPPLPPSPSVATLGDAIAAYMRFFTIPTQDSLSKLVLAYTGRFIPRSRISVLIRGAGTPPDSAERVSIAMTFAWLYRTRGDTTAHTWGTAVWQEAERERRRRGLP